ncbi:hypothetical protein [Pseudoduganella umbonata]|uniref:Phosphoglycerate mutase n=1 Tax=Pseudoduganella umbonata TaxID=864828 RepID=A0A4P8HP04_9BURK|nr:hypothetical protein [Pseudoduganella umbonata]MBB3220071.1 hypothetical protein [Pseudoduganella umbonata]QCP10075.1 hypothetical protein FCL38_06270 [Pseudoduganella umbonata]
MASTTLVLPFGLPPAEMAPDLVRALQAPALATLLSRNSTHTMHAFDADTRLLPHEAWLAHALGLAGAPSTQPAAPFAPAVMRGLGMTPETGHWFIFHPVHLVIGTHLMMPDLRGLRITGAESRALFDAALPLFEELGKTLVYGDAYTWFLRADDWAELATASPDAATGDNLHPWLPSGAAARDFRRLLNEVQMLWHAHPVNAARKQAVNSFWLWAGGPAEQPRPEAALAASAVPAWLNALAEPELRDATCVQWLAAKGRQRTAVLGHLIGAGLAEDWSGWLESMKQLEDQWFAPLLGALRAGQLHGQGRGHEPGLRIVLCNRSAWTDTTTTKPALNKFWRTENFKNLLT